MRKACLAIFMAVLAGVIGIMSLSGAEAADLDSATINPTDNTGAKLGNNVLRVCIDPQNDTVKDFHIRVPKGVADPALSVVGRNPDGSPSVNHNWDSNIKNYPNLGGKFINVYTPNPNANNQAVSGQVICFDLVRSDGKGWALGNGTIRFTSDGNDNPNDGPISAQGGAPAPTNVNISVGGAVGLLGNGSSPPAVGEEAGSLHEDLLVFGGAAAVGLILLFAAGGWLTLKRRS